MLLNRCQNQYHCWDPCTVELPFSLDLWGSHPTEENDDHYLEETYLTVGEAMADYQKLVKAMKQGDERVFGVALNNIQYVILTGPGVEVETVNPTFVPETSGSDDGWREEIAMQNGMAFGCDGYNDAMGY